jgi:hypothetical protein
LFSIFFSDGFNCGFGVCCYFYSALKKELKNKKKEEERRQKEVFFYRFFLVDPDQLIWLVTWSLDRVDNQIGFQNYGFNILKQEKKNWPRLADVAFEDLARVSQLRKYTTNSPPCFTQLQSPNDSCSSTVSVQTISRNLCGALFFLVLHVYCKEYQGQ